MLSIPHVSVSARTRRLLADGREPEANAGALVVRRPTAPLPPPSSSHRRLRRVVSRNCRNLERFGYDYAGFHRRATSSSSSSTTTHEQRMAAALVEVQQQVAALERRRALLESLHLARFANARQLAAHKTREYYDHFGSGFDPRVRDRSRVLESIVRSVLLETVQSPAFASIDQFLRQWANYSKYHAKVSVSIEAIEPLDDHDGDGDAVVVKCTGRTTFRISRETIEHFFQPVMNDEALVQQLIGKEYCFPFVTLFHFATDSGRVFRLEPRADLAAGLFSLVSDPFATVKLLRASQLTADGLLNAYPDKPATRQADVIELVGDAA